MNFLDELKRVNNQTVTENGAGALRSTMNACLDAFGSLAAMRFASDDEIIKTFLNAFWEDRALAMRLLFYVRDVRGGQGMRRVFRVIVQWLADYAPEYVVNNLDNFLVYGRGDDILCLLNTGIKDDVIQWAKKQLCKDLNDCSNGRTCSLLAKWLPSENASSQTTRKLAREFIAGFGITARAYRIMLSRLRNYLKVVECKMSANEWDEIDYNIVPSKAGMKYSHAFVTHDADGYVSWLTGLADGSAKVNAKALFPVDIIHKVMRNGDTMHDRVLYDAMWKALPNYFGDTEETGLCVVDTSGSMYGLPMEVAISLGIYCADKCRGPFAGHFITFSAEPQLQQIKGKDIRDKAFSVYDADWGMNTNLEAVFDLILKTAKGCNTPAEDMPKKLYIISDMQFDQARLQEAVFYDYIRRKYVYSNVDSFMETMRQKYAAAGYEMPIIVYWNVRGSRCGMFQATYEGEQCCMVSGYSPSLFKAILDGTTYEEVETVDAEGNTVTTVKETVDPMTVMLTTLNGERYAPVWAG